MAIVKRKPIMQELLAKAFQAEETTYDYKPSSPEKDSHGEEGSSP